MIYVPLTTENRGSKYEVELPKQRFLRLEGVANVQGIASLPVKRLERKLGELPKDVFRADKASGSVCNGHRLLAFSR